MLQRLSVTKDIFLKSMYLSPVAGTLYLFYMQVFVRVDAVIEMVLLMEQGKQYN